MVDFLAGLRGGGVRNAGQAVYESDTVGVRRVQKAILQILPRGRALETLGRVYRARV